MVDEGEEALSEGAAFAAAWSEDSEDIVAASVAFVRLNPSG